MTFRILLVVLSLSVAHSAAAQATLPSQSSTEARSPSDADMDRARAHFAAGQTAVDEGLYGEAYAQFAAGYSLSRRPLFLFNMAECARENGRAEAARNDYQRYLDAEPGGSMAEVARVRLSELPAPEAPEVELPVPDISPNHAAESAVPAPATPEPNMSPEPRRPLTRKWQFWTIVGAVVLAAGAAVVIGIAASGNGSPQCDGGCELVDLR